MTPYRLRKYTHFTLDEKLNRWCVDYDEVSAILLTTVFMIASYPFLAVALTGVGFHKLGLLYLFSFPITMPLGIYLGYIGTKLYMSYPNED